MTNPNIVAALEAYAKTDESVVEGALLVAQIINPATDIDWCRSRLIEIATTLGTDTSAAGLVAAMSKLGFSGAEEYYLTANSNLEHVLRQRQGIPISLAVVVIGIAQQLGLKAHGVNFPGHFIVAVDDVLIDPFSMSLVDETESRRWLQSRGLDPKTSFSVATGQVVVVRMLNNLTGLARASNDSAKALELTDYKLAVTPERMAVYLERAELWVAVGVTEMARRDLQSAAELAPDANTLQAIERRLAKLETAPTRLH